MMRTRWIRRACRSTLLDQRRGLITPSDTARYFKISEEVQQAIAESRPVVALESTIYTHGFPYPDNLLLASRLESLVRVNGGVPATIGILDGVARVGLGADELMRLVSSSGKDGTMKISRRDFGFALGLRDASDKPFSGGTTISATMILAHMAGIKVFATGGLGGVHRGAEQTMDVSADLTELGRTPVAVISSGCKAFLDLPKTLEYLETQGVGVATFSDGREGGVDFPGFWTRESGVPSPKILRHEAEAASVIHAHFALGLQSGLHFANPIPEEHSLPREMIEAAIYEAIEHANVAGAIGAAATPYILSKIKEITGSRSVESNRALIESNVVRATKVAKALRALELSGDQESESRAHGTDSSRPTEGASRISIPTTTTEKATTATLQESNTSIVEEQKPNVFVAGSLAIDLACDYKPLHSSQTITTPTLHTSNPAQIRQSLGGVGGNVARAAHLMGATVRLCSAIGDDLSGKAALEALSAVEMSTKGIRPVPDSRTAQYVAINDGKKDLMLAMADMSIIESTGDSFGTFWRPQLETERPSHLVLDANWPAEYLTRWIEAGKEAGAHITFEPVSAAKSTRLFRASPSPSVFPTPSIHLATPNAYELAAMHTAARESGAVERPEWWAVIDALGIPHSGARTQLALATSNELVDQGVPQQSIQLLPFIQSLCVKLGSRGVLVTQLLDADDERLRSGEYAPYILSRCANGTEESLGVGGVYMRLFSAVEDVKADDVVSVNGVGDTFAGTLVAGLASRKGARVEDFVDVAQRAAVLTLKSKEAVSPGLGTLRMLM